MPARLCGWACSLVCPANGRLADLVYEIRKRGPACSLSALVPSPNNGPDVYSASRVPDPNFGAGEVRDRPADFEQAAVGAGAESEFVDGGFQGIIGFFFNNAVALDVSGAHLRTH